MKWQSTDIKPNNGDVVVCFSFGKTHKENEYYVGEYNSDTDEVEFNDYMPENLDSFDLWTKINLPEMPVC